MNRRAFLGWLTGTAAGVAAAPFLDLDRLLWLPGEKTIFIPSVLPVSGNTFITPTWVAEEVARNWVNELKMIRLFDGTYA